MDSNLINQIRDWHAADEHQKIVEEILKIPEDERSYELTNLLARAYNNLEEYETALKLLDTIRDAGRGDDLWHFRRGYACFNLGFDEEAGREFYRVLELNPEDQDARALLQICLNRLGYEDDAPVDDPQQQALADLHEYIQEDNEVEYDNIYIPEWDVRIIPRVEELREEVAVLNVSAECPAWDRRLFECSVGLGTTQKTALTMAEGQFIFSVMSGIRYMMENTDPEEVISRFNSKEHRWNLYKGDIVGTGETPEGSDISEFWDFLKNGITNRLGNQKMVYIKVYAARKGEEIIGECRINDVVSKELSEAVMRTVENWDSGMKSDKFGSKKQFFFLVQDDETYEKYPHSEDDLKDAAVEALRLFEKCRTQEDYDNYIDNLTAEIGDRCLAEEMYLFIPEMCAEAAFPTLNHAETLFIYQNGETEVYKAQMASYYTVQRTLYNMLSTGSFSQETFATCVCSSSIYSLVKSSKENGETLENSSFPLAISFEVSSQYRLR